MDQKKLTSSRDSGVSKSDQSTKITKNQKKRQRMLKKWCFVNKKALKSFVYSVWLTRITSIKRH